MYYKMNNIYQMNAKSALTRIADASFDLVVTAPPPYEYTNVYAPWENNYDYNWKSLDAYLDDMRKVFAEVYRVMKNHHYCVVTIGDVKVQVGVGQWNVRTIPLPAYFVAVLEDAGFMYVTNYIWDKGEPKGVYRRHGDSYPFEFSSYNCCEQVLVFAKHEVEDKPAPCPVCGCEDAAHAGYLSAGVKRWRCKNPKCPSKARHSTGGSYTNVGIMLDSYRTENNKIPKDKETLLRRNIITVDPIRHFKERTTTNHSMMLPKEIADMAVMCYSGVGDKVLDPFMGSGMTAVAAAEQGRQFLGFMYDRAFYEVARRVVDKINAR